MCVCVFLQKKVVSQNMELVLEFKNQRGRMNTVN